MFRVIPTPYKVGDVIEQEVFGGQRRFVLVGERHGCIKNGMPGFDGRQCDRHGSEIGRDDPIGNGVWGYDYQVIRVVKRA